MKKLLLLSITLSLLSACTKERPYKEVFVDEDTHTSKSLITEAGQGQKPAGAVYPDDLYLYFPSTVNVSRTNSMSRPHWAGDAKLVKVKFTKDALKVVEVEKDPRFQDNELNNAPVLSLPIKHVSFKCAEDADGKCTNQEVENNEISWEQKDHFQVLVNQIKIEEVNYFPEQIMNLFFPCANEIGQEFTHYDVSKDALNIQVDKTYQSNILCAGSAETLSDLTYKVRYHFSLVKLNALVKPGYKPLEYMAGENNTFGFFDTRVKKLDADNNSTADGEKVFVNRWRPGSKAVYHLSENFNKPQYAKIKKATLDAVKTINSSLSLANAGLTIEIAEPHQSLKQGDLRMNNIVLEEDPLATGVIGYGPSIADPMTGEIVNARTVMYLGTLKKYIKNSYDEIVLEKMGKKPVAESGAAPQTPEALTDFTFSKDLLEKFQKSAGPQLEKPTFLQIAKSAQESIGAINTHSHRHDRFAKHSHNMRAVSRARSDVKGRLDAFLKQNCIYDAELFNFTGAIDDEVDKVIKEVGLKPWIALNTQEKEKVLDALLPFVWVPVLVHEMGHNLGLRHNFGASEDKANFYTQDELKEMGIKRSFNYSSVMDYAYRTTNELPIMGKYDIAALRFGYAEKVELANGELVDLQVHRKEPKELKAYNFCTDEHVGLNPNCNVFDEGTSLTEIAIHHATAYEDNYFKRNFRNNRMNFSLYQDGSYAGQIGSHFDSIRATYERYEDIKRTFGLPDNHPIWTQNEFLKDLKTAVTVSAAFLKKVLTTSDVLCAIAAKSKPSEVLGVLPLKELAPRGAVSCFDEEQLITLDTDNYTAVAQGGKLFQSMKDPRAGNPYIDQIDVRGIWVDKILALETILSRKTGIRSFDEISDNLLDVQDLSDDLKSTLTSIVNDEVVSEVAFVTRSGQVIEAQIPVQLFNPDDTRNGHLMVEPLSEGVAGRFGLQSAVTFNEYVVSSLKQLLPSKSQNDDSSSLLNSIRILKTLPNDGRPTKEFEVATIGAEGFLAHKRSSLAVEALQNFKGSQSIDAAIAALDAPEDKKDEVIASAFTKVIETKKANKPLDATATEFEKALFKNELRVLEKFAAGNLKSATYYAQIIKKMAQ